MTTTLAPTSPPRTADRPPFARIPVLGVAALSAVVLLASATRYGYFGDELYFLAAGRRLALGYADQGPILPLLARLMDSIAPDSLVVLRLPAIVLAVVAVVVSALIAREMGGGRGAQVLTATAYATSPFLLLQAKNLSTNSIDTALWVLITWLVVRWVRTRRDGLLVAAAVVTAVDMQVKWLVPFLWAALAVGALLCGPRELLRRPLLWWAGAAVVLVSVPGVLWQARHDWPQLALTEAVRREQEATGGALLFIPLAVILAGALGAVLLCYGAWVLLRRPSLRPYRFFGVAALLLTVIFMVTGGRIYYVAGVYPVLFAAGAVAAFEVLRRQPTVWRRRLLTTSGVVLTAASVVVLLGSTPWQPAEKVPPPANDQEAALNIGLYGEFGWPELADGVVAAYDALPPAERAQSAVLAEAYWQAAALDHLAGDRLPPVYSPARGFGYFGAPPDTATTLVCVGGDTERLRAQFAVLEPLGRVDTRLGFLNNTRDVTVWKCAEPRSSWDEVWPEWMHM